MIADFHIHSKYSYDSLLSPGTILKAAKKQGLDVIAITDHETITGGVETKKLNTDRDLLVIVGTEIQTEIGDIIGLFLTNEIQSRHSVDVIKEIKSQGGYVILPHPCRGHTFNEYVIANSDAIEVFNSRSTNDQNRDALDLAKKFKKPFIAGSDAHFASEIGRGKVKITLSSNQRDIQFPFDEADISGYLSPWYLVYWSQIIKSKKTNNFAAVPKQILSLLFQIPRRWKK